MVIEDNIKKIIKNDFVAHNMTRQERPVNRMRAESERIILNDEPYKVGAFTHNPCVSRPDMSLFRQVRDYFRQNPSEVNKIVDEAGRTSLHYAVRSRLSSQFVDTLLQAGRNIINPNIQDTNGITPLHYMFILAKDAMPGLDDNQTIIEKLIAAGAKVDLVDNRGRSASNIMNENPNHWLYSSIRENLTEQNFLSKQTYQAFVAGQNPPSSSSILSQSATQSKTRDIE